MGTYNGDGHVIKNLSVNELNQKVSSYVPVFDIPHKSKSPYQATLDGLE